MTARASCETLTFPLPPLATFTSCITNAAPSRRSPAASRSVTLYLGSIAAPTPHAVASAEA